MKGTPQNMQDNPEYKNVTKEVISYFKEKIKDLEKIGVSNIIIDPGLGFGKTLEHNYQLLNDLEQFKKLNLPILIGASRKSMIYKTLNLSPIDSLNGSTVLHTISLLKGANIIRVHDVKEANECIRLVNELKS